MFSGIISDEAVELLIASLYEAPEPLRAPVMGHIGFLRFLRLLVTFNWKRDVLVVDTTEGALKVGEVSEMQQLFKQDRSAYPPMAILTPWDRKTSVWTKAGPSQPILRRMVALARATLKLLQGHIAAGATDAFRGEDELDVRQLFRTSLADYDVLIRLNPAEVPRAAQGIDYREGGAQSKKKRAYKNLAAVTKKKAADTLPLVEHNPVALFVKDLQKHYGHAASFFYDELGGTTIGVVWDPEAVSPHSFKVAYSQDSAPVESEQEAGGKLMVQLNIPATLEGFKTLGRGLVKKLENQRQANEE